MPTGCSAAWLARLLWEQEAAGSNPAIPTSRQLLSGQVSSNFREICPTCRMRSSPGMGGIWEMVFADVPGLAASYRPSFLLSKPGSDADGMNTA
jgi:hypothetical protein